MESHLRLFEAPICQSSAAAIEKKTSLQLFWLNHVVPSSGSRDSTVQAQGRAPALASGWVLRAPGCCSPFKAWQQLMATWALPWHAVRALCAAGTGTASAPARRLSPVRWRSPTLAAAGGWHRMSGCPVGAVWGEGHHAGSR